MRTANPAGEVLSIAQLGFHGPDLVILDGKDGQNTPCTVFMHLHAEQIVLKVTKVEVPGKRRRIGFVHEVGPASQADTSSPADEGNNP